LRMSAGQVLADLVLAPRCAGCGDPGSWFCLGCRDLCDAVALAGAIPVRGAGTYAGPLREAIHRLKYGGERGLAAELGPLVARERAGRPQGERDRAARAANVRRAFLAEAGALRGLRVALVDDVATTGATLHDAASAARAAGARHVRAYVIGVDA